MRLLRYGIPQPCQCGFLKYKSSVRQGKGGAICAEILILGVIGLHSQIADVGCHYCGRRTSVIRDLRGFMKFRCPHCGVLNVIHRPSRRQIIIELQLSRDDGVN